MERGRPHKHEALVRRDQYWAISLREHHGESYASLERTLFPHVKVRKREHGEGYIQPFALSKVAAGTRGLGTDRNAVPAVIKRGEARYAGSSQCFRSILWRALSEDAENGLQAVRDDEVAPEVRARLRSQHLTLLDGGRQWRLTQLGVRRVGRLSHIDALGLLLAHSYPLAATSELSVLAEDCVSAVFARVCRVDSAFWALKDPLASLIKSRFHHVLRPCEELTVRTFRTREVSSLTVALMTMLRGGR